MWCLSWFWTLRRLLVYFKKGFGVLERGLRVPEKVPGVLDGIMNVLTWALVVLEVVQGVP